MLRLVVLALVLANAVYFAWTQSLLASYGFAPVTQAEPQRMREQIHPEAMRLIAPGDARQPEPGLTSRAASAASAASAPSAPSAPVPGNGCLQAGLFTDAQANNLRSRLETSLPGGSWSFQSSTDTGRWIIYMGKFANEEALLKKQAELRGRNQSFEPVLSAQLSPGLALGHYSSAAEAEQELTKATARGIRTARVVLERPEVNGQLLQVNGVDAALRSKLDTLRPQFEGRTLRPCR